MWNINLLLNLFTIIIFNISYNKILQETEKTIFEKTEGQQTATYDEVIDFYHELSNSHTNLNIQEMGKTDSGYPLHLVTFNPDKQFDFKILNKEKAIILINNGIHPGEPDGIEATMRFFEDLATGKIQAPKNTVIAAIPIYNIGGALNRNSTTRVNQNGPEEYGFRGNARNHKPSKYL